MQAAVHYVLVALLAGVVLFWRLGAPALEEHECRAALAARTMAEPNLWLVEGVLGETAYEIPPNTPFNHWVVPVENGRPRLVKTPLEYWLVAGLAGSGDAVNEWTARLPAAIAGVLCAMVTLALGRRMFSPTAALFGAAMFATCLGFEKWGRCARPEMTLCLMTTVAMACFYAGMTARSRWRGAAWMAAFWVALGLGNLSKEFVPLLLGWGLVAWLFWRQSDHRDGPERSLKLLRQFLALSAVGAAVYLAIALLLSWRPALNQWKNGPAGDILVSCIMAVCLGVPMAIYLLRSRGWKPIVRLLPTAVPGLILMTALFMPWLFYMDRLFPSVARGIFSHQISERAAGTGNYAVDATYSYIEALLICLLPWIVFIPGAFLAPLMKRFQAHRGALTYLFLWAVGLVMLFTCFAGKRDHYILPMIPAACLLMGFVAEDLLVLGGKWVLPGMGRMLAMGHGLATPIGIFVALAVARGSAQRVHLLAVAGTGSIPLIICGVLGYRRKLAPMVACVAIGMVAAYTVFNARVELWDEWAPAREFGLKAAQIIPPGTPAYYWEEPQLIVPFYYGHYIPGADWPFLRMEDLWVRRDGMEPNLAHARTEKIRQEWLADPAHAPWMVWYERVPDPKSGKARRIEGARFLEGLGYRAEYSQQSELDNRYVLKLYHRTAPTATAPGP